MPADFDTSRLLTNVALKRSAWGSTESVKPRERRCIVELPAVLLFGDQSAASVKVLDLSYNGCRIASALALLPGVPLTLSVFGLGKMPANVRWYHDGFAGLSFRPEPIDFATDTPRQHERVFLKAHILLRRRGRNKYSVLAKDVSPSGCRVEFVDRPSVGELHWVKFDGLDAQEAVVRWVKGRTAGLEFVRTIYRPVFELLLAKLTELSAQPAI